MNGSLIQVLERLEKREISLAEAVVALTAAKEEDLGFALLDHDREARCGVPEVIYGAGKSPVQLIQIAQAILSRSGHALATRCSPEQADALARAFGDIAHLTDPGRRTWLLGTPPVPDPLPGPVGILTAGTSDLPVAYEAELTCRALGHPTERFDDVGVAGLHRLLRRLGEVRRLGVLICIAGMEGALPSVVAGLVRAPVIAVPTSVGYGVAQGGMTALHAMLTSCAAGVTVVNIDNGFGAAVAACRINGLRGESAGAGDGKADPEK